MQKIIVVFTKLWLFIQFWKPLPVFLQDNGSPLYLIKRDKLTCNKGNISNFDKRLLELRGVEVILK